MYLSKPELTGSVIRIHTKHHSVLKYSYGTYNSFPRYIYLYKVMQCTTSTNVRNYAVEAGQTQNDLKYSNNPLLAE